jgi:hypothetical protein
VLDAAGNPVISYQYGMDQDLRILHCDDPNCDGIGDSITSPDTAGSVGYSTSLALDATGNPVVSYSDFTNDDLKVLHCDDPNCDGTGDSITSPDPAGGSSTSLVLDASGNPVIAYAGDSGMKLLHCDDPNCDGTGEIIASPDAGGAPASMTLDASGNPVVSIYDHVNDDLRLLHCNDPNCDGVGESVTLPDAAGDVGQWASLVLDAAGNPVVSYFDVTNWDLKVLHCDDPNCDGTGDSITVPDMGGGLYTSLALDASGNPVISYCGNTGLHVLHCDDPNCDGVGESITAPDIGCPFCRYTTLALDAGGNPVVGYFDHTETDGDLKLVHCDDPNCSGGDESITSPDTGGRVGAYTSLALDASGNPVVSYWDYTNGDLKILRCNDPNCDGVGESITSPDTVGCIATTRTATVWGRASPYPTPVPPAAPPWCWTGVATLSLPTISSAMPT